MINYYPAGTAETPENLVAMGDEAVPFLQHTFSFLDDKHLGRCRQVAKAWNQLILSRIAVVLTPPNDINDEAFRALLLRYQCIREIDISYASNLTSSSFGELGRPSGIIKLDVSGCPNFSPEELMFVGLNCRNLSTIFLEDSLWLTDKALKNFIYGKQGKALQSIALSGNAQLSKEGVSALVQDEKGRHLISLRLSKCPLVDDEVLKILTESCQRLQALWLTQTTITHNGVPLLAQCRQLEMLDLGDNPQIKGNPFGGDPQAFTNLKEVNLKNTEITDEALIFLACRARHLQAINLDGCLHITDKGVSALLENCLALQKISLNGCDTLTGHTLAAALLYAHHLTSFQLGIEHVNQDSEANRLSPTHLASRFITIEGTWTHPSLDLSLFPAITDAELDVLAQSAGHLKKLNASNCLHLSQEGIIRFLQGCPLLEEIELSGCSQLNGDLLTYLCSKKREAVIRSLVLRNCTSLTAPQEIKALVPLKKLEYLDVTDCKGMGYSILNAILDPKAPLTTLKIAGTALPDYDIQQLLRTFRTVKTLECGSQLQDPGLSGLGVFCTSLESLSIIGAPITSKSLKLLAENCQTVKALSFQGCGNLTDEVFDNLAKWKLEALTLTGSPLVSSSGLAAALSQFKSLRSVTLGKQADDHVILELARTNLTVRNLSIQGGVDLSVKGLQNLAHHSNYIQSINVDRCPKIELADLACLETLPLVSLTFIGDHSKGSTVKLGHRQLKQLQLGGFCLDQEIVETLSKIDSLEELSLVGCSTSPSLNWGPLSSLSLLSTVIISEVSLGNAPLQSLASLPTQLSNISMGPASPHPKQDKLLPHTNKAIALALRQADTLHPLSLEWLQVCAFLDPTEIPVSFAEKWVNQPQNNTHSSLIKTLEECHLIQLNSTGRVFSLPVDLHPILASGDPKTFFQHAVRLIQSCYTRKNPTAVQLKQNLALVPHLEVLIQHARRLKGAKGELADLLELSGRLYTEKGLYPKALCCLEESLQLRMELSGPESDETAQNLKEIGLVFYEQARYQDAEATFKKALSIWEKALGPDHHRVANCLEHLAYVHVARKEYDQALKLFETAGIIREKNQTSWVTFANLGHVYVKQQKLDLALESCQAALDKLDQASIGLHPRLSTRLIRLGHIHEGKSEYEKALKFYLEAKAVKERLLGNSHPSIHVCLTNIASIYTDQGRHSDVLNLYREAQVLCENVYGTEHPSLISIFGWIGDTYSLLEQRQAALDWHLKAVNLAETLLGQNHPTLGLALHDLGDSYLGLGNYEKGIESLQKAKQIRESVFGPKDQIAVSCLEKLGRGYRLLEKYDESVKTYYQVLELQRAIYGEESKEVASTMLKMGNVYTDQKDWDTAVKWFRAAEKMYRLRDENRGVASCLYNIGEIYQAKGEYEWAIQAFAEAAEIRKMGQGEDHLSLVTPLAGLASCRSSLGQHRDALAYYEQIQQLLVKLNDPEGELAAFVLAKVANEHTLLKDEKTSLHYRERAMQIGAKVHGYRSSFVAKQLRELGKSCWRMDDYKKSIDWFLELKKQEPEPVEHWPAVIRWLARAYMGLGDCNKAVQVLEEGLQGNVGDLVKKRDDIGNYYQDLGDDYLKLGRHSVAYKWYLEAYAKLKNGTDEERAENAVSLGSVCHRLGKYQEAKQYCVQAIDICQKQTLNEEMAETLRRAWIVKSNTHAKLKEWGEDRYCTQQALELVKKYDSSNHKLIQEWEKYLKG
ncbi:MAG: tetratricopeptide repeat protein [Parachlamydiales bacterium]